MQLFLYFFLNYFSVTLEVFTDYYYRYLIPYTLFFSSLPSHCLLYMISYLVTSCFILLVPMCFDISFVAFYVSVYPFMS